jgi:hypothetical protein
LSLGLASCANRNETEPEIIEPKTLNGNVRISNQQELNDFIDQKITQINGHLTIGHEATESPVSNDEISDISGLNILSEISGNLTILGNNELTNLGGLENLKQVGGQLIIAFNPKLVQIDALEALENISGALRLEFNDNLSNVEALNNLRGISSFNFIRNPLVTKLFQFSPNTLLNEVKIAGNERLSDLTGLRQASMVSLQIAANASLTDLRGLEATTHLNSLSILQNKTLASLNGLDNLRRIEHALQIEENSVLTDLEGMGQLEHGPVILKVVKNEKLQSIDRFSMTPTASTEFISVNIQSNPELTSIAPLKELTTLDQVQIYDNQKLTNLEPLRNLRHVKHLNIIFNGSLTNLVGLEQLREVEILNISGNRNLESLTGLNNLQKVTTVMEIVDNERLTDLCALRSFAESQFVPDDLKVSFNAFNPSMEEVRMGNCSK